MKKMTTVTHRFIETNGIRIHIAEAGEGPLVLLLHGFPESWYAWRHQLTALAQAGYHVVAPDQRGYGQTDRPSQIEQYTQLHLTGDIVGLLDALGEQQTVVVGHDCGAFTAWDLALLRPDRVRGVVSLSIPYAPRGPVSMLTAMRSTLGEDFYMVRFQQPGKAEVELERDVRTSIRSTFFSLSGDALAEGNTAQPVVAQVGGLPNLVQAPKTLPSWLTEQDLDHYTGEFERTGFAGALNWFRTIDKSWELMAAWTGVPVLSPALFIAGERDVAIDLPGSRELIANMQAFVPNLKEVLLLPGCGHWTQQERPTEVNAALIEFLEALPEK
ncbi:epoxide hydrolase [Reticulibacter mediterranei]|uniref:Epoxide hydrolase n=2 Tax=Reticulibacter mediterranei TaxID=2778369 RepID=A0A8J3IPR1_9CHLR|nr:epoxide hydrolase [Reticulibacter mediterranei]